MVSFSEDAQKERQAADAELERMNELDVSPVAVASMTAGESSEGVAASDLPFTRLACQARSSAASAKCALAEAALSNFPAPRRIADILQRFPKYVTHALGNLPTFECWALDYLEEFNDYELEGVDDFRSQRNDLAGPISIFGRVSSMLSNSIGSMAALWTEVGDRGVALRHIQSRREMNRSERTSILSAASSSVFSSLVSWRQAAADLVSASATNNLGEMIGSEALGCVRRKVGRSGAYPWWCLCRTTYPRGSGVLF